MFHVFEGIVKFFIFIFYRDPNNGTEQQPKWKPVCSKTVEYLHIDEEFQMNSNWTGDPSYEFYHSLPIPWREIPNVLPETCNTTSSEEM